MNLKKKSLEADIIKAVESQLSASHALSEKAKGRIKKSATKLAEKLSSLFEKEEKKASEKANDQEVADSDSPKAKKPKKKNEADK
ncbi:hypothetical protein [Dyadobacter sp. LHD-138]|uniref:hypothetical protein n=1 Tax=Dyadobacter sp. LHD-138 TaxID=3071413 RepID=UPI0027DF958E|nr:hypothetical protein [Dyadobacter sp. LHD-138]MDQ6482022.1 hypothetical protein [Dyadobacter sp. LHD-138]